MIINIYTPVYHRFLKTKKSIESIIDTIKNSKHDVNLFIGVNGVEGDNSGPMMQWIIYLARNPKIKIYFGDKNYGKAVMINYMFDNSRKCDYVISIDSDMIADENKRYNWIDEFVKIMEHEPAKDFGVLSSFQKESNCHILTNLIHKTEFLGHSIKYGPFGVAGGCIIMKEKDFVNIEKYTAYDIYNGDDALIMRKVQGKLKKLIGVVETIRLTHPANTEEEKGYQQWKYDKANGKLPRGIDTKGFYD